MKRNCGMKKKKSNLISRRRKINERSAGRKGTNSQRFLFAVSLSAVLTVKCFAGKSNEAETVSMLSPFSCLSP